MDDIFEVRDDVTDAELLEGEHLCMLLNQDIGMSVLLRTIQSCYVVQVEGRKGILAGYLRNKQTQPGGDVDPVHQAYWDTGVLPDGL